MTNVFNKNTFWFSNGVFGFNKGKFFRKNVKIVPATDLKLIKQFLYNHGQNGILYLEDKSNNWHIRFMREKLDVNIDLYGPIHFASILLTKKEAKELARLM